MMLGRITVAIGLTSIVAGFGIGTLWAAQWRPILIVVWLLIVIPVWIGGVVMALKGEL